MKPAIFDLIETASNIATYTDKQPIGSLLYKVGDYRGKREVYSNIYKSDIYCYEKDCIIAYHETDKMRNIDERHLLKINVVKSLIYFINPETDKFSTQGMKAIINWTNGGIL